MKMSLKFTGGKNFFQFMHEQTTVISRLTWKIRTARTFL